MAATLKRRDDLAAPLAERYPEIARYIWYDEAGYVVCSWSDAPIRLWDRIHEFAMALAENEQAVLMNEAPMNMVEYPRSAVEAQAADWEKRGWRHPLA